MSDSIDIPKLMTELEMAGNVWESPPLETSGQLRDLCKRAAIALHQQQQRHSRLAQGLEELGKALQRDA